MFTGTWNRSLSFMEQHQKITHSFTNMDMVIQYI